MVTAFWKSTGWAIAQTVMHPQLANPCTLCMLTGFESSSRPYNCLALCLLAVVLEGTAMSMCSKVMHPKLANGVWNAGLISTEAGTFGRLGGNCLLSLISSYTGQHTPEQLSQLAKLLFGLFGALFAANLGYMIAVWKRMAG